jgi:hypothetical protein
VTLEVLPAVTTGVSLPDRTRLKRAGSMIALVGWAALIGWTAWWGRHIHDRARLQLGNTPPLLGARRLETWQLWPAVVAAAVLLVAVPVVASRMEFRRLVLVCWFAATTWAVSVAATDGWTAIAAPMRRLNEYRGALAGVRHGPLVFLRDYTKELPNYPTQVKGHPPLPVLVLWAWEKLGFHGPGWSAALVIGVGTSSVIAVALTVRSLTDEATARRLLPFLVLAPATAWLATSMDAFFVGVAAWGVALSVRAAQQTARRRAAIIGALAGLLLGSLPYLSYGLLPFALIAAAAVVAARRAGRRLPVAMAPGAIGLSAVVAGAAAVAVGFSAAGFWWLSGVRATHRLYLHTYGSGTRPYLYFLIADIAVVAIMIGPAGWLGFSRAAKHRPLILLVAATLFAVLASDVSGYTRGEVERIWLPYAPWLLVAAANIQPRRVTLAAQILVALAVQALVLSPW